MADSVSVVRVGAGAGLWRAVVSGADSEPGGPRRHAERDRAEFNSVQPGGDGWSGAGRDNVGEAGGKMVFWAERAFIFRSDRFAVDDRYALFAGRHQGVDLRELEAGD